MTTTTPPAPVPATEPVVTVASITAFVTAVLALLTAFGLPLTDAQQTAILGVVAVIGPLVVAFVARRYVTPNVAVVEREVGGKVVAGEANEAVPTGEAIRDAGSMSESYEPQHAATPQDPAAT